MARKLKTYQTSLGFFDLAIAAPTMKAALQAWGAGSNLFHQGIAKETDDPDVVAATQSKPGVVLRRPAGSNGRFAEHAELPTELGDHAKGGHAKRHPKSEQRPPQAPHKIDEKAARNAALDLQREQKRHEADQRRDEAARARERERRENRIAKIQAALDQARRQHESRTSVIQAERAALEKRAGDEEARWQKQKEKLEEAVRRSRKD